MARRPSYTPDALAAVAGIKQDIERDVRNIAETLATHESTEKVLRAHVETAHSALAHLGLKRRRFYERVEVEAGVGGLCWAAAGALPGFLEFAFPGAVTETAKLLGIIVFGVIGAVLTMHAWMRGAI